MVLDRFYSAFARHDWQAMGECYTDDARFSDPVFPALDAAGVRAMWKMLLGGGTDLRLEHTVQQQGPAHGVCTWEARYTFGGTGRAVHNVVHSDFILHNGLIAVQNDRFDLWRWSRQAMGPVGLLLGWSPLVHNKVRAMAAARLAKAMRAEPGL